METDLGLASLTHRRSPFTGRSPSPCASDGAMGECVARLEAKGESGALQRPPLLPFRPLYASPSGRVQIPPLPLPPNCQPTTPSFDSSQAPFPPVFRKCEKQFAGFSEFPGTVQGHLNRGEKLLVAESAYVVSGFCWARGRPCFTVCLGPITAAEIRAHSGFGL